MKNNIKVEREKFNSFIFNGRVHKKFNISTQVISLKIEQEVVEVETVSDFSTNDVILDIRSIDEQNDKPLKIDGIEVISLPFYNLGSKFSNLDQTKTWLLWCERGIMSRLQALYLREQGFTNIKIYSLVRK